MDSGVHVLLHPETYEQIHRHDKRPDAPTQGTLWARKGIKSVSLRTTPGAIDDLEHNDAIKRI